jgi:hypothetical protein
MAKASNWKDFAEREYLDSCGIHKKVCLMANREQDSYAGLLAAFAGFRVVGLSEQQRQHFQLFE